MADLVVIVPSRGRPQTVARLAASFAETCTASIRLLFMVDIAPRPPKWAGPLALRRGARPGRRMVLSMCRSRLPALAAPRRRLAVHTETIRMDGDDPNG